MKKVKCKYLFKDDFNPKYVNGAQGGINPHGEIIINFFLERGALPISQTYEVTAENSNPKELSSEPADLNNSFVRVIENGVIMNYQTAKEIHNWLGNHLEQLEKITNSQEK